MAEPAAAQLEALSALVQQAKAVPMSASCMVNRSEALALIESARTALTDELTAARDATNGASARTRSTSVALVSPATSSGSSHHVSRAPSTGPSATSWSCIRSSLNSAPSSNDPTDFASRRLDASATPPRR